MGAFYGDLRVYHYPLKHDNPYKVVFFKETPRADYPFQRDDEEQTKISLTEGEKLLNNISRVRSKIRDYAFCNEWDYFVTLTFDIKNINRYDLKEVKKKLGKYFNNYKSRKNKDFQYLLVPEFHQDGAIHFHGLIKNLNIDDLKEFNRNDKLPIYILGQIDKGLKIWDWVDFHYKFGYTTIEPIRNSDAACNYIVKYVTKDLVSLPLGTCCYLNSKGLTLPELIHQDFGGLIPKGTYENDFVAVKWFKDMDSFNSLVMDI